MKVYIIFTISIITFTGFLNAQEGKTNIVSKNASENLTKC